jgi:hypothetical protein
MKLWKTASLILMAIVVLVAGYGLALARRGFSARGIPSVIDKFAASTARQMALPSNLSPASRSIFSFAGKCSGRHGTFL